jgi:hypothetical protein
MYTRNDRRTDHGMMHGMIHARTHTANAANGLELYVCHRITTPNVIIWRCFAFNRLVFLAKQGGVITWSVLLLWVVVCCWGRSLLPSYLLHVPAS